MHAKIKTSVAILLIMLIFPVSLAGAQYTSTNYKVNETFFGTGGNLDNQSANFKAKTAAGELAVGNISSPNFQAYAGFNTTDRIVLEVSVVGGIFDLGVLDTSQAKATTTTFTVRDYLSSGYTVQMVGATPSNSGHFLANMSTAGASVPGTEQFGINLVANNLPGVGPFGAAPTQLPNSTFGFGQVDSPYDTPNLFKYIDGDTVAHSSKSTGVTQYTLSMMANVNRRTAGGSYGTSLYVRVVPTY
jgi:hypothetical protein